MVKIITHTMEPILQKKCSGCKTPKDLDNFYKNKLMSDGRSNYCKDCTRDNSKNYFKRKKERDQNLRNETLLKMTFFSSLESEENQQNADNLMRILMIEKMLKSIVDEVSHLKSGLINTKQIEEVGNI